MNKFHKILQYFHKCVTNKSAGKSVHDDDDEDVVVVVVVVEEEEEEEEDETFSNKFLNVQWEICD